MRNFTKNQILFFILFLYYSSLGIAQNGFVTERNYHFGQDSTISFHEIIPDQNNGYYVTGHFVAKKTPNIEPSYGIAMRLDCKGIPL